MCLYRQETLGSQNGTAQSAVGVTATTPPHVSHGSAALHRSVRWWMEYWIVTLQVN